MIPGVIKWANPALFYYFFVFSIQLTLYVQLIFFAEDWIRTMDIWNWKRPLYQLSPFHCPPSVCAFYVLTYTLLIRYAESN